MGAGVYLDGLEIFHLMPLSPTTQALTRSIKVPALHPCISVRERMDGDAICDMLVVRGCIRECLL